MVGVVDQSSTGAFIGVGEGFCSAPFLAVNVLKVLASFCCNCRSSVRLTQMAAGFSGCIWVSFEEAVPRLGSSTLEQLGGC